MCFCVWDIRTPEKAPSIHFLQEMKNFCNIIFFICCRSEQPVPGFYMQVFIQTKNYSGSWWRFMYCKISEMNCCWLEWNPALDHRALLKHCTSFPQGVVPVLEPIRSIQSVFTTKTQMLCWKNRFPWQLFGAPKTFLLWCEGNRCRFSTQNLLVLDPVLLSINGTKVLSSLHFHQFVVAPLPG